jgi:metal-responsive CopG/Arc/MetJ family transcriptional regulator
MPEKETKVLNMNIDKDLLDRIEKYRFRRMFKSRSEAIEFLLDYALRANPSREPAVPKGE